MSGRSPPAATDPGHYEHTQVINQHSEGISDNVYENKYAEKSIKARQSRRFYGPKIRQPR